MIWEFPTIHTCTLVTFIGCYGFLFYFSEPQNLHYLVDILVTYDHISTKMPKVKNKCGYDRHVISLKCIIMLKTSRWGIMRPIFAQKVVVETEQISSEGQVLNMKILCRTFWLQYI